MKEGRIPGRPFLYGQLGPDGSGRLLAGKDCKDCLKLPLLPSTLVSFHLHSPTSRSHEPYPLPWARPGLRSDAEARRGVARPTDLARHVLWRD